MKRQTVQNVGTALISMLPYYGRKGNFLSGSELPASYKIDVDYIG